MLTKTDFDEIDKRFEKIDRDIRELKSNQDKRIKELIENMLKEAIKTNNTELLKIFATKYEIENNCVLKEEFRESKDTYLTLLDDISGYIKRIDTEQTIQGHQIQDQKTRLAKFETALA